MCGLAAAFPRNDSFVRFLLERQRRRGPDDTASVDLGFCSLGVNRLAISGLDGGAQPLTSSDGSIVVVFNGAIYNAEALVETFGISPKSTNDGEVIPFLYQRFGLDFANYLEGMFAICIADLKAQELVLAVDELGIKPMFLCEAGGLRLVASSVAAFPAELRRLVRRMPPGVVWSSAGRLQRIAHAYYEDGPLGALLRASVAEQIPEEVPWGCLLSGGVDSSVITSLASELHPGLKTFTCGVDGSPDLLAAREVSDLLGTTHHETLVDSEELPEIVDAVVEHSSSFDKWTVMTGVGTHLAARLASSEGVKVVLSGEGADELFGGYEEFVAVPPPFLNSALVHWQADLGITECLRLDSATMAHSIEARVPFLSTSLIRHARALAPIDKVRADGAGVTRKVALRHFARSVLPARIADRAKEEFARGSGLRDALGRHTTAKFSDHQVAALQSSYPALPIDDALSAWIFSRWLAIFGDSIGTDGQSLAQRGLIRQQASIYLPTVTDPATYLER